MPFTAPYRDSCQAGDLVYGLSAPRAQWIMKHGAGLGKNWIDKYLTDMTKIAADDAVNADFITTTLNHPKYHSVMTTDSHASTSESAQHGWRTKSKAGLNWAVTRGKHVHFILDMLNMEEIAGKSNTKGNPDSPSGKAGAGVLQKDKVRTITNAELRWVFRHKDNPAVAALVQFWLEDKVSPPPWDATFKPGVGRKAKAGPELWAAYTPTHTYSAHLSTAD